MICLFGLGIFRFEFLELLRPEMRRRKTHLVRAHQGADFGQPVLPAEVRVGIATPESLLFAVEWMKRRVKGCGVVHSEILGLHRRTGNHRRRRTARQFKGVVVQHDAEFATRERARQAREFILTRKMVLDIGTNSMPLGSPLQSYRRVAWEFCEGQTRTATVRTSTDCIFLTLARDPFLKLLQREPKLAEAFKKVIAQRLAASGTVLKPRPAPTN